MSWRPQLNVVCARCGKSRGLTHVCVSNSRRKATAKPALSFGKCPRCKKPFTSNPLAHTCHPASDFRKRRRQAEQRKRQAERKRKQAEKHDYQACQDKDCPRPLCVAFKTGRKLGYDEGYGDGFGQGYEIGYEAGIAACPRPHSG